MPYYVSYFKGNVGVSVPSFLTIAEFFLESVPPNRKVPEPSLGVQEACQFLDCFRVWVSFQVPSLNVWH